MRPELIDAALNKSLNDLQLSYLDLYLIHVPFAVPPTDGDLLREPNGDIKLDMTTDHVAIWKVWAGFVRLTNFLLNFLQCQTETWRERDSWQDEEHRHFQFQSTPNPTNHRQCYYQTGLFASRTARLFPTKGIGRLLQGQRHRCGRILTTRIQRHQGIV